MTYYRRGEHTLIRTGRAARTRVGTYMSVTRRQAVLTAQAGRVNADKTTTADYLRQLGADDAFVTSYSSPYGRTVAKVYRAETGAEPVKAGLAVRGRRLVPVFAYGAEDAAILEKAAREYKRTAELIDRPAEAPAEAAQQPQTVTTAALVAEMAQRHEVPAGFAAQRVEAILDGMRGNPRLCDPAGGAPTEAGARVVRAVLYAEDVDGMLRREVQAWQDAQTPVFAPRARVSLLVSDRADRATGIVRGIERNAIGLDVAEILLPGGESTHQVARFLTAA